MGTDNLAGRLAEAISSCESPLVANVLRSIRQSIGGTLDSVKREELRQLVHRGQETLNNWNRDAIRSELKLAREELTDCQRMLLEPLLLVAAASVAHSVAMKAKKVSYLLDSVQQTRHYRFVLSDFMDEIRNLQGEVGFFLNEDQNRSIIVPILDEKKKAWLREREEEMARRAELMRLTEERRRKEEEQRQLELRAKTQEAYPWADRFQSAIQSGAHDEARHALYMLEAYGAEVLSALWSDWEMRLSRMRHALDGARREQFGRSKVRCL